MAGAAQWWKRLDRGRQRLVLLLGAAAAVGLTDAVVLRPLRLRLVQLHREVRETEQRLVDAMVAGAQTDEVAQALGAYQPYLQPAGSEESELAAVLTEVESAVRASGMVLLNLKPQMGGKSLADAVSVTVEAEASPPQLVELLDRLQRSTRLLRVTELHVRVSEGRTLRASLVVSKLLLGPVG